MDLGIVNAGCERWNALNPWGQREGGCRLVGSGAMGLGVLLLVIALVEAGRGPPPRPRDRQKARRKGSRGRSQGRLGVQRRGGEREVGLLEEIFYFFLLFSFFPSNFSFLGGLEGSPETKIVM